MTEDKRPRSSTFGFCYLLLFTFLFILAGPTRINALEVPALKGRVNDYAGTLPSSNSRDLERRLQSFEEQTGHQIVLLTIPTLGGEDLEAFSIRVAETWKIGKKGFDNGAILLVVRDDRKLRIEVGYGLEGVLPDAVASRIIREVIVPHFRAGDYSTGIEAGIDAILRVTSGEVLPTAISQESEPAGAGLFMKFVLLLFAIGLFSFVKKRNTRRVNNSWSTGGSGYFGGGFGGGGFGGGFSGGGGGFGGGGASGGW